MNLTDIKTWVVNADHKARPKNSYEQFVPSRSCINTKWQEFNAEAAQHTYSTDETLPPGEYPAEMFDSPVKQCRHLHCDWQDGEPTFEIPNVGWLTRWYLPLKSIIKKEVKEQETHISIEEYNKLKAQLNNQARHKESLKGYWLSCSESKAKWVEAIKEYFESEHLEIKNFEDFKYQFDLD